MEAHKVGIQRTFFVTPDVKCFRLEKPEGYTFVPGQATEVAINREGWTDKKRPFTFTSLPEDDYLEFTIKLYLTHRGVTNELQGTGIYDELILHEVFGAINYQGPGIFIAGGAGITPFISIFRDLDRKGELNGNALIFGNKTKADIILEDELKEMLGDRFISVLSEEDAEGYGRGLIDRELLQKNIEDFDRKFYVCGPPPMMDMVLKHLSGLGVKDDFIIKEEL